MPRDLNYGSGTQNVSGTHVLTGGSIGSAGIYVCELDLSNLVGGATPDQIRITAKFKVLSSNSEQVAWDFTFTGGLLPAPGWESDPVSSNHSCSFTLTKVQGTSRDIYWRIIAL